MPQNSTLRRGAMTSRSFLPRAASSSAALGRANEIPAGLLVRFEFDEASFLRIFEEVGERLEPIVGLVESGFAALERLLDHRAPDLLAFAALGDERAEGLDDEIEGLLLLVPAAGGALVPLLGRAPLLLFLA